MDCRVDKCKLIEDAYTALKPPRRFYIIETLKLALAKLNASKLLTLPLVCG